MGGGGKSGGAGQTYNYYGTIAGALCVGPVDELVAIIANGQEVWPKGKAWHVGLACVVGTLYVFDAQSWTCTANHTATNANAPGSGLNVWKEYSFARGTNAYDDFSLTQSDGTHLGTLRFYWGTNAQTADYYLLAANNDGGVKGNLGNGDTHPDYQGICYIVLIDFLFGQEVQSGPNIEIVLRRKPNQALLTGSAATVVDGQCNIAAALVEILTDKNLLGLPTTMIDTTSFQAVGDLLEGSEQLYGASILIDSSEQLRSVLDALMAMFDGYIRFNPATKLIELGIYQHGAIPGSYATLTADQLTKPPKFTTTSWQGTVSRAVVRYNSRQLNYQQTSEQVDDPRAFFVLGVVRDQALDRPHIARQAQARIHGRETLRVVGHAVTKGTLEVRREFGRSIRAGDYVFVDVDLEPGGATIYKFFRVTQRKLPPVGPVLLELLADNTLAAVPWNNTAPVVVQVSNTVPAIANFRVLEVPSALSGSVGAVTVLAQRPNNLIIGNYVYVDTDPAGTFLLLGDSPNFAAQATLNADVALADGTLHLMVDNTQVDAGYFTNQYTANDAINDTLLAVLVSVSAGQVAEAGGYAVMEICSVSVQTLLPSVGGVGGDSIIGVGGDTLTGVGDSPTVNRYDLTVLRGRKGTVPTAFAAATTEVWLIPAALLSFFTANLFDTVRANRFLGTSPATLQFRFAPYTFSDQMPLSDAANHAYQFPLKSASVPSLTLTAPATTSLTYSSGTFPIKIKAAGKWETLDNSLVKIEVKARLASEDNDRKVLTQNFAACSSKSFTTMVQLDQPGSWMIKLIATDATGVTAERDIPVSVTSASPVKCALPQLFAADGTEVVDVSGQPTKGNPYVVNPGKFFVYGAMELKCSTPGAVINFKTTGAFLNGGGLAAFGVFAFGVAYVADTTMPFLMPAVAPGTVTVEAWATAPGYADSGHIQFILILNYP